MSFKATWFKYRVCWSVASGTPDGEFFFGSTINVIAKALRRIGALQLQERGVGHGATHTFNEVREMHLIFIFKPIDYAEKKKNFFNRLT